MESVGSVARLQQPASDNSTRLWMLIDRLAETLIKEGAILRNLRAVDRKLALAGRMLATLASAVPAPRPVPRGDVVGDVSDPTGSERRQSGALLRVDHVGEICAQALYEGHALTARDPQLREMFVRAAREEGDHLHWTRERLRELNARPSLLNPLWYAGALALGVIAGRFGDRASLGFMAETERQVERHLDGHLQRLPVDDLTSRAIVQQMRDEEAAHAKAATDAGGVTLPAPVKVMMQAAAGVMTRVAHYI